MSRYNDRGEREYAPPQRPHGAVAGVPVRSSAHQSGADAQDASARAGPSVARLPAAAASAAAAPAHPWAQRSHRPAADRTRSRPSHAPYPHAPPAHHAAPHQRDAQQRSRPAAAHSSIMPPPGPPRTFADGPFAGSPMPEAYTRAMSRLLSAPPGSEDRSSSSEPRITSAVPPARWAAGPSRPASVRQASVARPATGGGRSAGPHISKSDLDFLLSSAASRGPSVTPSVLRGASVLVSPAGAPRSLAPAVQAPSSPSRAVAVEHPREQARAGNYYGALLRAVSAEHVDSSEHTGAQAPAHGPDALPRRASQERGASQSHAVVLDGTELPATSRQAVADGLGGASHMPHEGLAQEAKRQSNSAGDEVAPQDAQMMEAPQDVQMTEAPQDTPSVVGASGNTLEVLPAGQSAHSEAGALQLPDLPQPQAVAAPLEAAESAASSELPVRAPSAPLSPVPDTASASEPRSAPEAQSLAEELPLAGVLSAPQPSALVEPPPRSEPTSALPLVADSALPPKPEPPALPPQHAEPSSGVAPRSEAPLKPAVELRGWFLTAAPGKPSSSLGISELGLRHWIYVEGTVAKPDGSEEQWHSSLVVRRQDPSTVLTASGSRYVLLGPMAKRISRHNGWSAELCERFADGFPDDWVQLAAHDLAQKEAKARDAKSAAARRSVASAGPPVDGEGGDEAPAGPSEPKKRARAAKSTSATKKAPAEELEVSSLDTVGVATTAPLDRTSKARRSSSAPSRKKAQAPSIATAERHGPDAGKAAGPSSKMSSATSEPKPHSARASTGTLLRRETGSPAAAGPPSPSQPPIKAGARKRPRESVLPPSSPESPDKELLDDAGRDRPPSIKKARPDEARSRVAGSGHAAGRAKLEAQSKAQLDEAEHTSGDDEHYDQSSPRESEDDSDIHDAYVPTPRKPKRVPAARRRSDNAASSASGSASKVQRHASDPTGSKKQRSATGKSKARPSDASTSILRPAPAHFAPPPLPPQDELDADMPPIDDFGDDSDDLGGLGADESIIVPGNISGPVGWVEDADVPEHVLAPAEAQENAGARARAESTLPVTRRDAELPPPAAFAVQAEQLQSEVQSETRAPDAAMVRIGESSTHATAAASSSQAEAHEPLAELASHAAPEQEKQPAPLDEQILAAHEPPADSATSNKAVSDDEVDGAIGPPRSPEVQAPSEVHIDRAPVAPKAVARETSASAIDSARAVAPTASSARQPTNSSPRSTAATSRPHKKAAVVRRASAGTTPLVKKSISREVANLGRTAFGVIGVVRRAIQDEAPTSADDDEEDDAASEPEASTTAAQRSGRPVRARASNGVGRWWEVSGSPMPARAPARSRLAPVKAQASVSSTLASPSAAAPRKSTEAKARVSSAPQPRPAARRTARLPLESDASDSNLSSPDDRRAGSSAHSARDRPVQPRPTSSTSNASSAKRRRSQSSERKAPATAAPRKADVGKSPARPKAAAAASSARSSGGITFAIADPSEMAADAYDFSD